MLHGWGLNLRVFDPLAAALESTRRLLRMDLPGHGRSPWDPRAATLAGHAMLVRDELAALVDSDRPVSVLGWSLGGQIAVELAIAAPELVDRLVLIATTPRHTTTHDWPHGMPAAVLGAFEARLESDWREAVREFLELQVRGSSEGERVLRDLQAALLAHGEADPRALAAGLASFETADLRERLELVRQPALLIAGQHDRITPPRASRALAEGLSRGDYLEFRRAGHAPFLSHAAETAAAVQEFLA
jgi:pimeloyl-[acyl-carrier protein] methyl ester esterase